MNNNLITISKFFGIIIFFMMFIFIPPYIMFAATFPSVINSCNKIEINKPLNKSLFSDFEFILNIYEPVQNNQYYKFNFFLIPTCSLEIKNNIVISKKLSFI